MTVKTGWLFSFWISVGILGHTKYINKLTFSGQIDDVRIYNYALTKQQIQQVFNQGSAVRFGPQTGTP